MTLVTMPVLLLVLSVGTASLALAAGGGGSAGGADAQRGILKHMQTRKPAAISGKKASEQPDAATRDKAGSDAR